MSDQGFREVQLSGKQVVFLFMALAVALVGTFLLGVSAGKGVAPSDPVAQATPTPPAGEPDPSPATPLPPATTPTPGQLEYQKTLQGKDAPKDAAPVTPAPTPSSTPAPTSSPVPTAKPAAPAPSPAAPARSAAPAKSADKVWWVTVASFSSRSNAADQVAQLKTKGITSTILTVSGSSAPYKVRVGPMERSVADAMVTKLRKEGLKPSSPSR